jgi:hypothetical protein
MSDLPHPSGYENSDADPRLIAALAAGIAIFLILVPAILVVGYPEAKSGMGRSRAADRADSDRPGDEGA